MSTRGGDRKSYKFHQQKQGEKKRLLITDFLATAHSKQRHLKLPRVISAKNNLEREKRCINDLNTQLKEEETSRGNTAVERCRLEEIRPGFFLNPRTSNEIKVVYDWTTSTEEIDSLEKSIKDQKKKFDIIEATYKTEVESAKKEQVLKDEIDNEMSIMRRNVYKTPNGRKSGDLQKEDSVLHTTASYTPPSKCSSGENTSLVATQVGMVRIYKISDDGFRVSGCVNQSPGMKFYSGVLFKGSTTKTKYKIRDKAKHIHCSAGFIDAESGQKYHLTSIGGHEIKAVPVDSSDVQIVHIFRFNSITSRFNWIVREDDTASGLSNVRHTFGESVMPSNRSRVRKSSFLKNPYVPMPDEKRKRKVALKKTGINDVYKRYKSSRLTPSTLIDKALLQQPVYASCLKLTKDGTGIYDTCCNKELPLVFQNLMSHIKTTKHQKKFDSKIEAEKCVEDITNRMKSSQEEKGVCIQANLSSASNDMRIDVKLAQLKSYSPISTVSVFANVINRHAIEGNVDNVSHISDYTPFIHANELDRLVKEFATFNKEFSMVQDSTYLFDEQFGICCRAMQDEGLWVQQRLIGLWSINHHLSGLNISFVIEKACERLGKLRSDLIAMMADRVSANGVAQKDLVSTGESLMAIPCFSHTLDKIGNKFDAPELNQFMKNVRSVVSLSHEAKQLFRSNDSEGKDLAGYAEIRWWNDWVQQVQIYNMGIEKVMNIANILKSNEKCKKSSEKLLTLMEDKKKYARLIVQMAASIDYAKPFCQGTFNLEGDADGLAFVTGTEIMKIGDRISSSDINIDRLRKASKMAASMIEPLVNEINGRLIEAIGSKDEMVLELGTRLQLYDKERSRKDEEGAILNFGAMVTMNRRVGRHQVKGVLTGVHVNELDGTVKYDVAPSRGVVHTGISEFDLVKSAEGTRASQNTIDLSNLNANTEKKRVQDIRLSNMERLNRDCDDQRQAIVNAETTIEGVQDEFSSLGLVTEDQFVSYGKKVVKPGLEYAKKRFIDVEVENTGRGAFAINKGLQATKAFNGATIFNPEVIATMDTEHVISHLKALLHFDFVTEDMVDDAILECDLVLNHAKQHPNLPDVCVKDHSTMQKTNVIKKKLALKRILARRRREKIIDELENVFNDEGYVQLPNGILPNEIGVNELRSEQPHVTKKAYAIMEWWRCTGTNNADTGIPRYKAFPSWGRLIKLIALCVPSSASVERVFSQLKLCLSAQRNAMLVDEIETSLILRVNDVAV